MYNGVNLYCFGLYCIFTTNKRLFSIMKKESLLSSEIPFLHTWRLHFVSIQGLWLFILNILSIRLKISVYIIILQRITSNMQLLFYSEKQNPSVSLSITIIQDKTFIYIHDIVSKNSWCWFSCNCDMTGVFLIVNSWKTGSLMLLQ